MAKLVHIYPDRLVNPVPHYLPGTPDIEQDVTKEEAERLAATGAFHIGAPPPGATDNEQPEDPPNGGSSDSAAITAREE